MFTPVFCLIRTTEYNRMGLLDSSITYKEEKSWFLIIIYWVFPPRNWLLKCFHSDTKWVSYLCLLKLWWKKEPHFVTLSKKTNYKYSALKRIYQHFREFGENVEGEAKNSWLHKELTAQQWASRTTADVFGEGADTWIWNGNQRVFPPIFQQLK